jgi:hypothetical protein
MEPQRSVRKFRLRHHCRIEASPRFSQTGTTASTVNVPRKETGRVAKRYPPLAEGERIMPAFAKIALVVAFVSAIVWFGHHGHPHNNDYAALHDAGW